MTTWKATQHSHAGRMHVTKVNFKLYHTFFFACVIQAMLQLNTDSTSGWPNRWNLLLMNTQEKKTKSKCSISDCERLMLVLRNWVHARFVLVWGVKKKICPCFEWLKSTKIGKLNVVYLVDVDNKKNMIFVLTWEKLNKHI